MLEAASADDSRQAEEEIFQRALALEPEARLPFIREETREDPRLYSAVVLLLQGYQEAGGDTAQPTQAGGPSNRARWASTGNEEPGTVFNHFRLIRLLGEGGMGSVWRAEQTAPVRRTVALKVIKLGMDTREVVKRFERERQTLALLNHPNIAQVFEAGATTLGRPYFAMELVEGQAITAYCERSGLDLEARLRLFQEVCAAVEHAHQKGVIHRDLKPSNILVANGVVKVIDFGVAKATQGADDLFFTQQARIIGTPAYMSPEQAQTGGVDVDTRTDVYALGVVLYELLTDSLPIDSTRLARTSLAEMQRILLEEDPPTPSTRLTSLARQGKIRVEPRRRGRSLRGDLDRVVMKAIRKDRDERYASAAALSEDLRRHLANEPVSASPPTLTYQAGKFIRRHRAGVAASTAILAALLAGLVVSLVQVGRANLALAGEAKARAEVTFTLSDMFLRSGLVAGENHDPTRAELWFANAAILGAKDTARAEVNRLRAATWREEAMKPVRAFETGFEHLRELSWNSRRPALIVQGEGEPLTQIWNLENEQPWQPPRTPSLSEAAWDYTGDRMAGSLTNGSLLVLEYPSGKQLACLTDASAGCLRWSPDDRWIATGNVLWDWRSNEKRPLPQSVWRIRFSRDGRLMLVQGDLLTGVCSLADPGHFLYPPVPARSGDRSDFLGDGGTFVVGQPAGGLSVYDSKTGVLLHSYTNSVVRKNDGRLIASSPNGRFIARWNQPVFDLENPGGANFPVHKGQFNAASFSPDGSLLASGGYDNRLELWSLPEGKFLGEVGHHHTGVVNVEFSPDGNFVASGEDGLVRVWRVHHPELVRHMPAGDASLAMISPDGKLVAASGFGNQGSGLKETQAIEIATGRPAGPKMAPGGLLMDGKFSGDGAWIALAVSTTQDRGAAAFEKSGGSGNIQLWNPVSGQRLGEPITMPSEPRGLCLHPAGSWIGVYCAGGEGVEINTSNHELHRLFNDKKPFNAGATLNDGRCAYAADGRIFAAWGSLEHTHLWDRELRRDLIPPFERASTTFDLAFFDKIGARAVVAPSMRIEFIDLVTGRAAAPAIPFINWPFLTRFSGDGNLLLTAGGGRTAQVWNWRQGTLACPMLPHDDTIMGGCFVPGTPWVITGGHDGKIKFWDRRTGLMIRPPLNQEGWVLDLQLTPDARTLIASGILREGIALIDLNHALSPPDLAPEDAKLLGEIDADAEIHPGGGLDPLTPQAWLKKWRDFRAKHPNYPAHRLAP
jgi:serine/threonine protein kinase/WD40 repeat protein